MRTVSPTTRVMFALAVVVGPLTALLPGPHVDTELFAISCGLTLLLLIVAASVDEIGAPQLAIALTYLLIVALMRQSGLGGATGFYPLVILPVVWVALYGTQRQLLIVVVVAVFVLLVPWALIGGSRYPSSTPRSALLVLAVASIAGWTIQRLLGEARQARDLTEAVLDTAGVLIVVTDREGRIERFNRAAERVTSVLSDEALGRPLIDLLVPAERRDTVRKEFSGLGPSAFPREYEQTIVTAAGEHRLISWDVTCLVGDDGAITHLIAAGADITDQRRAAEALRVSTIEALAAARAKSEFVANMSHELRTPLNGVIGMLELLEDTPLTGEQRALVRTAVSSGDALVGVVNDVLDFSKIEAGKLELERRAFDPREIAESTCEMLAPDAHAKGVELNLWVGDSVPGALVGDAHRIRQVLTNLVANAVKFTTQGEVSVHIDAVRTAPDRARLQVEIADTGIGIEADKLAQLFEAFTQADSSTTRRFGGTGLGLAISRRLVRIMDGELIASSVPGEGSRFRFDVPLTVVDAPRPSRRSRTVLPPTTRVLVVDDNATNRRIVRGYLRDRVVVCHEAAGGAQALAMLEAAAAEGRAYDVVVLDSEMPELSGADVVRAVRLAPALAGCRIVMLTSAGQGPVEGVERQIGKPIRRAVLLDALAEALSGDAELAETVAPPPEVAAARGRVLVAEDNAVNQLVIETLLRRRGFLVDRASDGVEAVARLDHAVHGAVFMDCQMPNLDGYEATAQIRTAEHGESHVPIIAMTAHALPGDRERCLRAGMDDYLSKPIRTEDLDPILERWLPVAGEPTALLDRERLRSLSEVGPGMVEKLIDVFARSTPPLLAELVAAVDSSDDECRRRLAHKLRGGSEAVGALRLSELASRLEDGGGPSDAAELEPVYAATLSELRALG
jgi:two-component system, sensor histidine kinase and response regulator